MDLSEIGILFFLGGIYLLIGIVITILAFKFFIPENSERSLKIITLILSFFIGVFYMSYIAEPVFIGFGDHLNNIYFARVFIFAKLLGLFILYVKLSRRSITDPNSNCRLREKK